MFKLELSCHSLQYHSISDNVSKVDGWCKDFW